MEYQNNYLLDLYSKNADGDYFTSKYADFRVNLNTARVKKYKNSSGSLNLIQNEPQSITIHYKGREFQRTIISDKNNNIPSSISYAAANSLLYYTALKLAEINPELFKTIYSGTDEARLFNFNYRIDPEKNSKGFTNAAAMNLFQERKEAYKQVMEYFQQGYLIDVSENPDIYTQQLHKRKGILDKIFLEYLNIEPTNIKELYSKFGSDLTYGYGFFKYNPYFQFFTLNQMCVEENSKDWKKFIQESKGFIRIEDILFKFRYNNIEEFIQAVTEAKNKSYDYIIANNYPNTYYPQFAKYVFIKNQDLKDDPQYKEFTRRYNSIKNTFFATLDRSAVEKLGLLVLKTTNINDVKKLHKVFNKDILEIFEYKANYYIVLKIKSGSYNIIKNIERMFSYLGFKDITINDLYKNEKVPYLKSGLVRSLISSYNQGIKLQEIQENFVEPVYNEVSSPELDWVCNPYKNYRPESLQGFELFFRLYPDTYKGIYRKYKNAEDFEKQTYSFNSGETNITENKKSGRLLGFKARSYLEYEKTIEALDLKIQFNSIIEDFNKKSVEKKYKKLFKKKDQKALITKIFKLYTVILIEYLVSKGCYRQNNMIVDSNFYRSTTQDLYISQKEKIQLIEMTLQYIINNNTLTDIEDQKAFEQYCSGLLNYDFLNQINQYIMVNILDLTQMDKKSFKSNRPVINQCFSTRFDIKHIRNRLSRLSYKVYIEENDKEISCNTTEEKSKILEKFKSLSKEDIYRYLAIDSYTYQFLSDVEKELITIVKSVKELVIKFVKDTTTLVKYRKELPKYENEINYFRFYGISDILYIQKPPKNSTSIIEFY